MKKALFLLGLLFAAALVSCSLKDELQQTEHTPRFRAELEQPFSGVATKVYVDDTYHLFWNAGDYVSIFYETTLNRQFQFTGSNGDTAGGFKRSDVDPTFGSQQDITTGYNYAIFPWYTENGCDTQGNLKVIIPDKPEYVDDRAETFRGIGARALMVSKAKADENGSTIFYFKHVGAYLGISLKGDGVSVASISFRDKNSKTIAGRVQVSFDDDGLPVLGDFDPESTASNAIQPSSIITMEVNPPVELKKDEATVFWLNVPAGKYSGYEVTVTDPDGGTFTKIRDTEFTLERAGFTPLKADVEITPASIPVTGVELNESTLEMTVGDDPVTLTATVLPANATNKSVTWESSDATVATVENGVVTAVAAGTATITVTTADGGKTATCDVTVKPKVVAVESVSLAPSTLDMYVGDSPVALTATVSPVDASNKAVTWGSDNSAVATVNANGEVSAVAVGTTTITVTTVDGEKTATCAVTVKAHVASVSLDKTTLKMFVGDDPVVLTATVNPVDAADKSVTWTSSDSNVATVDANGEVTAIAEGTATITVKTVDGGKTATCAVTVSNVVTYAIVIDPAEKAEVNAGSTFTFKLMLTTTTNNVDGVPVDVAADATWTSSDDNYATITKGIATGVKEGNVTITAEYTNPKGDKMTITAPLKVNKKPNQGGDDIPIGGGGSF